METKKIS